MKRIVQVICIAALMALSAAANATLVSWKLQGHLIGAYGGPPDIGAGDPFTVLVNFNSAATLLSGQTVNGNTGVRYSYDASSLSFDIFAGTTCHPCHISASDPGSSGIIFVRDGFSLLPNAPQPIDGYTFNILDDAGVNYSVIMRGPILDLVNGTGLPENPDPRLASYGTPGFVSNFQVCFPVPDCTPLEIDGTIESVARVPEPHTIGLLGMGMLGLAARSRRRSSKAARQAR
jgi:hypothetical protein